jgi:hypothetical protein
MLSNLSMRVGSIVITLVLLFGLPYWAFLETGRPFMEWTFLIGVYMTTLIFYCHGQGYRGLVEQKRNEFFRSIPFWISLSYTLVFSCLTYVYYGEYF